MGVREQLRHWPRAPPYDLDDRHRGQEGTVAHRRLAAQPAARSRVRRRQAVLTAEASKKIARYDPATDRSTGVRNGAERHAHGAADQDARTIFTSNISSNSVSAIQQGADGKWTQTIINVGKGA
jgi:hypothetical protein